MTSLEEKFINFYQSSSSPEAPGINDIYSVKDIQNFEKEIKVNYSASNKIQIKKEFIKNKIVDARQVEKGIDGMIKKFNLSELPDMIDNKFPEGYNPESIQNLKFEYLNNSATKFKELCGKLFQDVYTKKINSGELESIFGSMSNYPVIVPQSFGLIPIEGLWQIFNDFYLKSTTSFVPKEFFKKFLNFVKFNEIEFKNKIDDSAFDDTIFNKIIQENYENFNSKIWYDLKIKLTDPNSFVDSYGFFFEGKDNKKYVYLKFSNKMNNFCKDKLRNEMIHIINKLKEDVNPVNLTTGSSDELEFLRMFQEKDFSERKSKSFNSEEFLQSINKYFTEIRKNPKNLLNSVRGKTNYDKIEVDTPLYKSVRALLHFSNIYTTYMKLLANFFKNIYECYKIYLSLIKDIKRKSQNKSNKEAYLNKDIDDVQKKLNVLLSIIKNIPEQFNSQLVDYKNETDSTIKFIGYKEIKYDWVANFRINTDDDFMKILMTFFKLNEKNLPVGGIPMKILKEESDFNKFIVTSFNFFLKYRFKSNKQYIELLENYKKKADEKLPREKYSFVTKEVEKKISEIEKDTDFSSTVPDTVFDICKKILKYSIIFVFNLYIKTIKQFKSENNTSLSKSEITNKIGEFKEYINQYIFYLCKNKLTHKNYYTFNQFLFGYLSQYIYLLENYNEKKSENAYKKLQILLKDKNKNSKFEMIADNIVKILTDKDRSLTIKKRLGIVGREYTTLSNNAKREINRYINPDIYTPLYWANYEKKFMENNGNKKLFVIAVEPKYAVIEKLAKVNVYLIDLFATLKSDSRPKISREIKTIRVFKNNSDNTITKEIYSNENNMIELNHVFRTLRDIAGMIQKSWSKNIFPKETRWDKKWVRRIFGRIFSAKGLQKPGFFDSTPGHTFAKIFGIYKREIGTGNKKENLGYTATEKLQLLTNGKLSSYTQSNKNQGDFINMALLMGYNKYQLDNILKLYGNYIEKRSNRLFDFDPGETNDWQVYVIRKENYESANSMREWANRLLNSKPLIFLKEYEDPTIIPLSDFNKIQAPFSRYFIKSWIRHTYPISKDITDYLLDIFNGFYIKSITKEDGSTDRLQNTLFVSADTFFDYDKKFNYEDNSLTKSENRNSSVFNVNNESSGVKFEANKTFNTNSLVKIPNTFKSKPLIPPSLKPAPFKLTNVFSKSPKSTIVSGLSSLSDTITKFNQFLTSCFIKNNKINILENKNTSYELEFDLDNFKVIYNRIPQEIKYDSYNDSFNVKFTRNPTNFNNELLIEFKYGSINFNEKDSSKYYLLRTLENIDNKNFILNNNYDDYKLSKIFDEEFEYKTNTFQGFFFYTNTNTAQNIYKLKLIDDQNKSIFEVILDKSVKDSTTYKTTNGQLYTKKEDIYLFESTSEIIVIKSIPKMKIYKYETRKLYKIDLVSDLDGQFNYTWREIESGMSKDDLIHYFKNLNESNNNEKRQFLINTINQFRRKHSISSPINSSNGVFEIKLTDGTTYKIRTRGLSLIYKKNTTENIFNLKLIDSELIATIQNENQFDPKISFHITVDDIYVKHNFNSRKMNFNGDLILNFEKPNIDKNIFILNNTQQLNTEVVEFVKLNQFILEILKFFKLEDYNNFNEIYFGKDLEDTNIQSLLLRPLDKDRKPIKDINLYCSDDRVWLENFNINPTDESNYFVKIIDDTAYNFYKTESIMKPHNQPPYHILFDKKDNKIYKVVPDSTGLKVFELVYAKNFGYSFKYLISPGPTLIDRINKI